MFCIILAELAAISVFKYWPAAHMLQKPERDYYAEEEPVILDEIIPTRQASVPALPPRPQIPVPVPNDEIIETEIPILDLGNELSLDPIGLGTIGEKGVGDSIAGRPQQPPRLLKIVEPAIPEEARKAGIIAEVYITFLVGLDGEVEDLFISEIRQYKADKSSYSVVNSIGYGIPEAAMEAAEQWRFRPATEQGTPVRAYTTQVFSFGF